GPAGGRLPEAIGRDANPAKQSRAGARLPANRDCAHSTSRSAELGWLVGVESKTKLGRSSPREVVAPKELRLPLPQQRALGRTVKATESVNGRPVGRDRSSGSKE